MPGIQQAYEQARNLVQDANTTATVSFGILLGNVLDRGALVVHDGDPFDKQMGMALPSALPAQDVTGNQAADAGLEIALSAAGLEAARRTSSRSELAVTAVSAQMLACVADAGIERSGLTGQAESAREDVGFSAIASAWFTKFLLDRRHMASDRSEQRLWTAGAATFALAMTLGAYLIEGRGGIVDAGAHATGMAVGGLSHVFGKSRRGTLDRDTSHDAAAQDPVAVVNDG